MLQEKWEELVDRIKSSAKILSHTKEPLEPSGEAEILEFLGPAGKMKIVRRLHPKVKSQKILAHRKTEGAQIENVYSNTETVDEVLMFVWDDEVDEWREKDFAGL